MIRIPPQRIWLGLASIAAGLVIASLILTAWLHLHPCYMCIFQRLMFMLLVPLALLAVFASARFARLVAIVVALLAAAAGAGVAGYQIWIQAQPAAQFSCTGNETPSMIEHLVSWLGEKVPMLFLADGNCGDKALVILGLSLAAWSLIAFIFALFAGFWALIMARRQNG